MATLNDRLTVLERARRRAAPSATCEEMAQEVAHMHAARPAGMEVKDFLRELLQRIDSGATTPADQQVLAGCSVAMLRLILKLEMST